MSMAMADNQYLFGKRFPNRLFVGGLPVQTTAEELASFFANYGLVKETKIICDSEGLSKGYGFVTFNHIEDVVRIREMGTIFFKNKKLNLGPAVKKEGPCIEPETVIVPNAPSKGQFYYPCNNIAPATSIYPTYTSYPAPVQQNIYDAVETVPAVNCIYDAPYTYDVNVAYPPVPTANNAMQEVYYYTIDPYTNTVYWLPPPAPQGSQPIQELQPVQYTSYGERRNSYVDSNNSSESERDDHEQHMKKKKSNRRRMLAPRFKKGPKHGQPRTE